MTKDKKKLYEQDINLLEPVNGGKLNVKIENHKYKNVINNSKKAFIDGTIEGDITLEWI